MHIVLIHPEIPHNTGAIGRICVGLDWSLHLIRPLGFTLDEKHLKRAGMDYWQHLDLHIHNTWQDYLDYAQPAHVHFLSTKADKTIYDVSYTANDALAFGCEGSGLPKEFYETYQDDLITIPMPGPHARSINLANAVAIAAYTALPQL